MEDLSYDLFKFVTVGSDGVGKSSLVLQFTSQIFYPKSKFNIALDLKGRVINIDGRPIKLAIWDTGGLESFKSLHKAYYSDAAGVILVYDITRRETFDQLATCLEVAREHGNSNMVITLVGNKCDLSNKRVITHEEGEQFAKENGLSFFEVSAKSGLNVEKAFVTTASTIFKNIQEGIIDITPLRIPGIWLGRREQFLINNQNEGGGQNPINKQNGWCCF